jgi:hypothetical protein
VVPGNPGNHKVLVAALGEASKQQSRFVDLSLSNKCLIEPQELLCMPEGLTGLMRELPDYVLLHVAYFRERNRQVSQLRCPETRSKRLITPITRHTIAPALFSSPVEYGERPGLVVTASSAQRCHGKAVHSCFCQSIRHSSR